MNRFATPTRCEVSHHRNNFAPVVRAALGVLDRVAEGIDVPAQDIELALQVTGDAEPIALRELRDGGAFATPSAGPWRGWHEGPAGGREPHPRAGEGRP
jgi:hypothetical protein